MSGLNVVDSSGWLEYLADGPNADAFADAIEATETLVVPTILLFEVFKRVLTQRGESAALEVAALMQQGKVIDLTAELVLKAAKLSHFMKLPMTDSLILATSRSVDATLWTQDADFAEIPDVSYRPKPS